MQREIPQDHQSWRKRAACRPNTLSEITRDNDNFFLGRGGKATKARELCETCPVKRNCLAFALYYGEEEGIWGGLTPDERRDMPDFMRELMMIEAGSLIDMRETRDPLQWLPIIFPEQREALDEAL